MVIYLNKISYYMKYISIIVIFILLYLVSYKVTSIRYKDNNIIDNNALIIENNHLKEELNLIKEQTNIDYINLEHDIVRVINRDLYNFYNEITINTTDVIEGQAVINSEGLIGIISSINEYSSNVALLTANINISVKINDYYGNLKNNNVTMLDTNANINIGDKVYTSGLTKIPKGIYVGEVVNVTSINDNLNKLVEIKLISNDNLNYVAVIKEVS